MKRIISVLLTISGLVSLMVPIASADSTQLELNQTLAEPVSRITFKDQSNNDATTARLLFPLKTASFKCRSLTDGASLTTLGTNQQKLFVSVPDRVSNGWDVSIAPSNGAAAGWFSSNNSQALGIDDATAEGCQTRSDDPSVPSGRYGGLLAVTTDGLVAEGSCSIGCGDAFTSPTRGPNTTFASTESATLYHSDLAHVGWEGTLTNVQLQQTIPAGVPSGDYSLPMTVTLTEL